MTTFSWDALSMETTPFSHDGLSGGRALFPEMV